MTNTTIVNNLYPLTNGTTSSNAFVDHFATRDPNVNDVNFPIQKKWLNTIDETFWELQNFITTQGIVTANWVKIGSQGLLETLTGNTGGAVPSTNNNINVVGDGIFINTVGTPGTSTLTIEPAGGIATLFTEDTGTASAMAGNLNVFSGTGITTTGSGNTITISVDDTIATIYTENTGTAIPASGNLNVLGTGPITTTGSGNTVTINTNGTLATSYVEDSGTAAASGGILNILGSGGISTSGSGNTVTISGSGTFGSITRQVFTVSGTYTPTSGMQFCVIECLGGGGAGGGGATTSSSQVSCGSGGGGGEYASGIFSGGTIGISQSITIGAGGTPNSGSAGGNGGSTSVGALITALGGSGGTTGSSNGTVNNPGGLGGTGGTGGNLRSPGSAGLNGWGVIVTSPAFSLTNGGQGASSQFGAGGVSVETVSDGNPGIGFGSGGSGGQNIPSEGSTKIGGAGASGIVIITEYV